MSRQFARLLTAVVTCTSCWARTALACPICDSSTGEQVRAGIVGGDATLSLIATFVPIALTVGIISVIHFGGGRGSAQRGDDDDGQ